MSRWVTSRKRSESSSSSSIAARSRSSIDSRCFTWPRLPARRLRRAARAHSSTESTSTSSVSTRRTRTSSPAAGRQVLAHEVGPDRQLAVAAVDEDRELHRAGPAELVERVERGAHRATGVEHVVDEHDDLRR